MADKQWSLTDYIDVAERIQHFLEKYPEGSLQQYVQWEVRDVAGQAFIVYTAAAYRSPEDHRPGIGTAWEPFPGRTPYTKDSELMNAETAAWGRAIVALGLTANRKIASRQEVQARQGDAEAPQGRVSSTPPPHGRVSSTDPATPAQLKFLRSQITQHKPPEQTLRIMLADAGADGVDPTKPGWASSLKKDQASQLIERFKSGTVPTGESDLPFNEVESS